MYIAVEFNLKPLQPASDILVAELAELGFESFVETEAGLIAYVEEPFWDEAALMRVRILKDPAFQIQYAIKRIKKENWNAIWEKSFEPIRLGDICLVRAPFHPAENLPYEIIIEPKMSFGTGHHETTSQMLQAILELDLEGTSVLDMGCGTGVLAILAAMKGAGAVDAVDIDPWSYTNTLENAERNGQGNISVFQGDAGLLKGKNYDVIFANINRNILLEDLPAYASCLNKNGVILVSGFYSEDLPAISEKCGELNLKYQKNTVKNNWVCAKYVF